MVWCILLTLACISQVVSYELHKDKQHAFYSLLRKLAFGKVMIAKLTLVYKKNFGLVKSNVNLI